MFAYLRPYIFTAIFLSLSQFPLIVLSQIENRIETPMYFVCISLYRHIAVNSLLVWTFVCALYDKIALESTDRKSAVCRFNICR